MEIDYIDDILTIKINCNLIAPNIKVLVEETKRIIEQTKEDLQLIQMDLSESKGIDSMGITFLVGTFKTLSRQNKKMRLIGVSNAMLKLFKTMKLDTVFEIENTVGGRGSI